MSAPGISVPTGATGSPWRRRMMRDLAVLLVFKLAALSLLWFLFFSAASRPRADAGAVSHVFGVNAAPDTQGGGSPSEVSR